MKKYIKIIIISLIILLTDIISKIVVTNTINFNDSLNIINNFFSLTLVKNYGAAWSILNNKTTFLILVSFIALIVITLMIKSEKKITKYNTAYYSLIIGGILGNLSNRIFFGYVIDFFDFNIFGYNFPIFNIADISIVISIFLMLVEVFKKEVK